VFGCVRQRAVAEVDVEEADVCTLADLSSAAEVITLASEMRYVDNASSSFERPGTAWDRYVQRVL
jgi:hypothetical protein